MPLLSNVLGWRVSVKIEKILQRCLLPLLLCMLASQVHAEDRVFNINIKNGTLPSAEKLMRVKKGDQVTWKILSDADGQLHIHAYHIELNIQSGVKKVHSFQAFATGRYRVDWHPESERGKGIHREEGLALFEVFPK